MNTRYNVSIFFILCAAFTSIQASHASKGTFKTKNFSTEYPVELSDTIIECAIKRSNPNALNNDHITITWMKKDGSINRNFGKNGTKTIALSSLIGREDPLFFIYENESIELWLSTENDGYEIFILRHVVDESKQDSGAKIKITLYGEKIQQETTIECFNEINNTIFFLLQENDHAELAHGEQI